MGNEDLSKRVEMLEREVREIRREIAKIKSLTNMRTRVNASKNSKEKKSSVKKKTQKEIARK